MTMNLSLKGFNNEVDALVEFLTSSTCEYHGIPNVTEESVRKNYENGVYTEEGSRTFWVVLDENLKVGMVRVFDMEDNTPLLDIRISEKYRGMGVGEFTIREITKHIFTSYEDKIRIEGYTRQDNYAMRTVFHKCGYAKEAYHRKAWRDKDGNYIYDAIGYGITKEDWQENKITPINWDDFKF